MLQFFFKIYFRNQVKVRQQSDLKQPGSSSICSKEDRKYETLYVLQEKSHQLATVPNNTLKNFNFLIYFFTF